MDAAARFLGALVNERRIRRYASGYEDFVFVVDAGSLAQSNNLVIG
jgi:hypothetical protein